MFPVRVSAFVLSLLLRWLLLVVGLLLIGGWLFGCCCLVGGCCLLFVDFVCVFGGCVLGAPCWLVLFVVLCVCLFVRFGSVRLFSVRFGPVSVRLNVFVC